MGGEPRYPSYCDERAVPAALPIVMEEESSFVPILVGGEYLHIVTLPHVMVGESLLVFLVC